MKITEVRDKGNVKGSMRTIIKRKIGCTVKDGVWDSVYDNTEGNVRGNVYIKVWGNMYTNVRRSLDYIRSNFKWFKID